MGEKLRQRIQSSSGLLHIMVFVLAMISFGLGALALHLSGDGYSNFDLFIWLFIASGVAIPWVLVIPEKRYFNFVAFLTTTAMVTRITMLGLDGIDGQPIDKLFMNIGLWVSMIILWTALYALYIYPTLLIYHQLSSTIDERIFPFDLTRFNRRKSDFDKLRAEKIKAADNLLKASEKFQTITQELDKVAGENGDSTPS